MVAERLWRKLGRLSKPIKRGYGALVATQTARPKGSSCEEGAQEASLETSPGSKPSANRTRGVGLSASEEWTSSTKEAGQKLQEKQSLHAVLPKLFAGLCWHSFCAPSADIFFAASPTAVGQREILAAAVACTGSHNAAISTSTRVKKERFILMRCIKSVRTYV